MHSAAATEPTRRDEKMCALFTREIEEMKQRTLIEVLELEILENQRPGDEGRGQIGVRQ